MNGTRFLFRYNGRKRFGFVIFRGNGKLKARPEMSEPQRVRHNAQRTAAHCRRRNRGAQHYAEPVKNTRRYGNADNVIEKRPKQILTNVPQNGSSQLDGRNDIHQIVFHQNDIRRFNRDVRPRADGDSDIRTRQRRRIVYAVTDHCDDFAFFLQTADFAFFVLRQHF